MATDIASLFGITPQGLSQQRYQQDLKQGYELAQLDPGAAARATLQSGVGQLGRGIAGMMGVEDPQMKLISARQSIIGQLDQTDPTSLLKGAQILTQMGDQQGAFALADYARKAQESIALAQQRNAQAKREAQQAIPPDILKAQTEANLKAKIRELSGYEQTPEIENATALLTDQLNALTRTKEPEFLAKAAKLQELKSSLRILKNQPEPNKEAVQRLEDSIQAIEGVVKEPSVGSSAETVSKELYFKPFSELTQDQVIKVNAEVTKRKKEEIRAGVTPAAQQQKQVSKNKTDLAAEVETSAYNSTDRVTLARNLKSLLPTAFTGVDANLKLQASRVAEVFGINIQGVPDSQIIDTILGEMTIGAASKLKGALSDKDVKFLKETIGTRGLSLRTLQFVADKIEQEALIDGGLNEVVNKYVASGGDLNNFNFASQRKDVAEKVRKDLQRLSELRNKAKTQ